MKNNYLQTLFIALIVSLGGFLFGFDASVISGVTKYIKPQFSLGELQLGWVVSAPTFSAMFAMLTAGSLSDWIGRKKVLIFVAFLYFISAVWSAFADGYTSLVIARMLGGLAFGAALVLAPVYIAEIAPPSYRGRLVSVQQLNIVLGFSAAYFSNYWLQTSLENSDWLTDETVWRWMFGLECFPAILYFSLLFFVPPSPRWLILKGKPEMARKVLNRILGAEAAEKEAQNIMQNIDEGKAKSGVQLSELFSSKLAFVMSVGLILGILQQVTGVNAIYFYATTIFEQSGVGTNAAFAQAVWVGIINVIFTLIAMALIDKIGRKPLLMMGLLGIFISMGITSYGFSQARYQLDLQDLEALPGIREAQISPLMDKVFSNDVAYKKALIDALGLETYRQHEGALVEAAIQMNPLIVLFGILGFVASFAISLGPVMWVMLSEMYPNRIRALAISSIGFINSFSSWLVQFIFPWELANWGNAYTYLIYALLAIVGFFWSYRFLPETKGRSLEELERELIQS